MASKPLPIDIDQSVMTIEIERKFIAQPEVLQSCQSGTEILQGYLYTDALITVRVRKAGDQAFLTWKGRKVGSMRLELETEIPLGVAESVVGPHRPCATD